MKLQTADGRWLKFKPLTDEEYDRARRLSTRSLDTCPTCGGREKSVPGSGMKEWDSPGFWHDRQHLRCDCPVQMALHVRYLLANIGAHYQTLDWDNFTGTAEADEQVRQYIDKWSDFLAHGFGLTFASTQLGVGKTFAATHIAKELVKRRQTVYFLDFVQMVDAFCGEHHSKQAIEQRMRETTFLVLDDVRPGVSERQTDLYALKFEVVIRHRTNFNLPTILTTNMPEPEFEQEFPRLYSLLRPKQMWVNMDGVDYRALSEFAIANAERVARGERDPIT